MIREVRLSNFEFRMKNQEMAETSRLPFLVLHSKFEIRNSPSPAIQRGSRSEGRMKKVVERRPPSSFFIRTSNFEPQAPFNIQHSTFNIPRPPPRFPFPAHPCPSPRYGG